VKVGLPGQKPPDTETAQFLVFTNGPKAEVQKGVSWATIMSNTLLIFATQEVLRIEKPRSNRVYTPKERPLARNEAK
jgi:hypothetical protein